MSLASTFSQKSYVASGAQSVFPTTFAFKANEDITVQGQLGAGLPLNTLVRGVDYNLTGAGAPEPGGNVTFIGGNVPAGIIITITRNTPRTQPTSFPSQGEFLPAVHEAAFDREEMQLQEQERRLSALEVGGVGVTVVDITAAGQKVQTTFNVLDPPEGSFPFNLACVGTPTGVTLMRVEDLTDPAAVQSVGVPDVTAMLPTQFTVRNVPGLIPGHQYRLTFLVLTL